MGLCGTEPRYPGGMVLVVLVLVLVLVPGALPQPVQTQQPPRKKPGDPWPLLHRRSGSQEGPSLGK